MSRVPKILHAAEVHATAPRAKSVYGILAATAAAIIASLMTVAVWTRSPAAAEGHHAGLASAAPAAPAASPGTSVPEASGIFNAAELTVEEPSPTF